MRALAEPLRGLRVLHLTAAGSRLRSPEILPSLLSLYVDLGLRRRALAVAGERPLWQLVRELEDGLQGAETAISDDAWDGYLEGARSAMAGRLGDWDVVVAHGPGPLAAATGGHGPGAAAPGARRLRARVRRLGASRPAGRGLRRRCRCPRPATPRPGWREGWWSVAEAIDPLAPGSIEQPAAPRGLVLRSLGVDTTRPCCCQLRPFDRWQDPHDVHRRVRAGQGRAAGAPARAGRRSQPARDLEDWRAAREVSDYAGERTDVLLLTSPRGPGQPRGRRAPAARARRARALAARGLRAVAPIETLWKRTPVVAPARAAPRIPSATAASGYLVDDARGGGGAAGRAGARSRSGDRAGPRRPRAVRERFLVTRRARGRAAAARAGRRRRSRYRAAP